MTSIFFVQCTIKPLLESVFVTSREIKVLVRVISLSLRLWLITLTKTLIIVHITETSSNNCLLSTVFYCLISFCLFVCLSWLWIAKIAQFCYKLTYLYRTWKCSKGEVGQAVKLAVQYGYRHLDCAALYMNEAEIGAALREVFNEGKVKREDIFITSKLW